MLDFTGYGCVNCRKMEAAVWTAPEVAEIINNKYILVTLHVDDKTPLPEPIVVTENGQEWANLIQMTIISTTVGKNPLEEMEQPSSQEKSLKCSTWMQSP